jgi:hypothetical protein
MTADNLKSARRLLVCIIEIRGRSTVRSWSEDHEHDMDRDIIFPQTGPEKCSKGSPVVR